MKTTALVLSAGIFLWYYYAAGTGVKGTEVRAAALKNTPVDFKTQVQPILVKNCTPCHFPGGKLYEKLPFDKAETITGNQKGIVKRINDETEKNIIRLFIEQQEVTEK